MASFGPFADRRLSKGKEVELFIYFARAPFLYFFQRLFYKEKKGFKGK
jgi:hypothetical protein